MSRRTFCVSAGATLVGLGLTACAPGDPAKITVGDGVEDPGSGTTVSHGPTQDGGASSDLAQGTHDGGGTSDMAHASADMAHSGSCSGPVHGGSATSLAVGTATLLTGSGYALFLCRDASGLYAMDAGCTHEGRQLEFKTTYFYCPRHGARFDLNGEHPTLPAFYPLDHYAVCVDASGNVLVDPNTVVAATSRA